VGSDITVVIPSIPPRAGLLHSRALPSVLAQSLPPDEVIIAIDHDRKGAGPTRTRALRRVATEWVAFLDDDDELLSQHLETLKHWAVKKDADVVWSWFSAPDGGDVLGARGRQWDPANPHTFPITALVRTSFAQRCEFPAPVTDNFSGDDFPFWTCVSAAGARFFHVSDITWRWWNKHGGNTSGAPGRW